MDDDISSMKMKTENVIPDTSMENALDLKDLYFCDIYDYLSEPKEDQTDIPVVDFGHDDNAVKVLSNAGLSENDITAVTENIINSVYDGKTVDISVDENKPRATETAVIEFSAETLKNPAVDYILNVKPGENIYAGEIIGSFSDPSSSGRNLKILSCFNKGTVRKDTDNGFGKLFGTVCSRHIIIDNAGRSPSRDENGTSPFSDVSYMEMNFENISRKLSESCDAFNLLTDVFPYLLYPVMLYARRKYFYDSSLYIKNTIYNHKPFYCNAEFENIIHEKESIDSSFLKKMKCSDKTYSTDMGESFRQGISYDILLNMGENLMKERNSYMNSIENLISISVNRTDASLFDPFYGDEDLFYFQKPFSFNVIDPETLKEFKLVNDISTDWFSTYYSNIIRLAGDSSLSDIRDEFIVTVKNILKKRILWENKFIDASGNKTDASIRSSSAYTLLETEVNDIKNIHKKIYDTETAGNIENGDIPGFVNKIYPSGNNEDIASWPKPVEITAGNKKYRVYTFGNEIFSTDKNLGNDVSSNSDIINVPVADISAAVYDKKEMLDPCTDFNIDIVSDNIPGKIKRNITPFDIKYWKRYCTVATAATAGFLATGLVIHGHPVKFPCIYLPFHVFHESMTGFISVMGISIRGIWIDPFILFLNMSSDNSSIMTPLTDNVLNIKNIYSDKFSIINSSIKNICMNEIERIKGSSTSLLKENIKYKAAEKALNNIKIGSDENIKDNIYKDIYNGKRISTAERISDSQDFHENISDYSINDDSSSFSKELFDNYITDNSLNVSISDKVKDIKKQLADL